MSYWPWWAGALALGSIAVGYAKAAGRTLGVSGTLRRAMRPVEELENERVEQQMSANTAALEAALRAATAAEFGGIASSDATGDAARDLSAGEDETGARGTAADATPDAVPLPSPWLGQAAFIAMIAVGAFLATLVRTGHVDLSLSPGATYEHLVAGGWRMLPFLLVGGVFVGFGTRMSGGCTSGHGLSGCGRLVPSSLAATAAFFGMGVVTSFVLAWVAR